VLAEQVVQLVAAGCGLGDQMLVIQLVKMATGGGQASVVKGGGRVGVDARARNQAEPAEQPLRARGEVGVGQAERRADRHVLRVHEVQPVPCLHQLGGQAGAGPDGMVAELAGQHRDRQRQIPAQPGELADRGVLRAESWPCGQPG
jgi:hypothetical protein